MDIIEVIPPKHFHFSLPNDTHRTLTITNLTLHSVYIRIIKSHTYEISLSNEQFFLQAFEQKKIEITINWNQEMRNTTIGKLRIFYYEIEGQASEAEIGRILVSDKSKYYYEDLAIYINFDFKALDFLNYKVSTNENTEFEAMCPEVNKKYYLMSRVQLPGYTQAEQKSLAKQQALRNEILSYLQSQPEVISIQACEQTGYIIQFSQKKEDTCEFISFQAQQLQVYYISRRIVAYGTPQTFIPIVHLYDEQVHKHKKVMSVPISAKQSKQVPNQKQELAPTELSKENNQKKQVKKKQTVKQSFAMRRETEKIKRRKNKSQQKIIQHQSDEEEDEEDLLRLQLQEMKRGSLQIKKAEQNIEAKIVKINQTNIQMCQKILNVFIDRKADKTEVYVILRDCIRCFILEQPAAKKIIKFDPIYEENVNMQCPVDLYKHQLIFGNQTSLFWVNLNTGESEWKYVQRKYIYALAVIEQLSLVSVGGKNFSKLAYFGKQTSRSNIKLYSCSSSDKHEHLFTYDIPGDNVGNVMNMAYITVPPLGTKLLLVHTLNAESIGAFYFLRVKAFNKVQVYGQIELDQIGILKLVKFKYNPASQQIICMQTLGETEMDTFKKLKVKCQYQKVEVFTQGIKVPLKKYLSFQLGGDKQGGEWMTLVDESGSLCYQYEFNSGKLQTLNLGNGEIKQMISVGRGKYLLIFAESFMKIRENLDKQQ